MDGDVGTEKKLFLIKKKAIFCATAHVFQKKPALVRV